MSKLFSIFLVLLFYSNLFAIDHVMSTHPNSMPKVVRTYNGVNKLELIKETEYYSSGVKSYQKTFYKGELKDVKKWSREGVRLHLTNSSALDGKFLSINQNSLFGEWVCNESIGEDQRGFGNNAGEGFQIKYVFEKDKSFKQVFSNNFHNATFSGTYSFYENIDFKKEPWNCINECCRKCDDSQVSGIKFSKGSIKGPTEIIIIFISPNQFLMPDDNREEYFVYNKIK